MNEKLYYKLIRKITNKKSKLVGQITPYIGILGDKLMFSRTIPDNSILVFGFWRSGTTWLIESLASALKSRTVFEPLAPPVPKSDCYLNKLDGIKLDGIEGTRAIPYIRSNADIDACHNDFYREMLTGKISNVWTNRVSQIFFLFRQQVVIKTVYGSLIAAYLQNEFGCRAVFLVRHPCAVVASVLRNDWGSWMVNDQFLDLLLDQVELRNDYLKNYIDFINEMRGSNTTNVVLLYSMINYIILRQIENNEFKPILVKYEELVRNPSQTFQRILKQLGYGSLQDLNQKTMLRSNSDTTTGDRKVMAPPKRIYSWKEELTGSQIRTIEQIVGKFNGLESMVLS